MIDLDSSYHRVGDVKTLADAYSELVSVELAVQHDYLAGELKERTELCVKKDKKMLELHESIDNLHQTIRDRDTVILSLENTIKNAGLLFPP